MVTVAWLALALGGCDDTDFPTPPSVVVDAKGFEGVQQVFGGNCTGCHEGANPSGGLDLFTDPCGALVEQPATGYDAVRVAPGDPNASVLWNKLADSGVHGSVMPPSGALSTSQVDLVAGWITDGADCDQGGGDTGGDGGDGGDEGYTFQRVQDEVLSGCTGCHVDGGLGDSLVLTSDVAWVNLVDAESSKYPGNIFVVPGSPEQSFLFQKLAGTQPEDTGDRMPYYSAPTTEQLTLVYGWIYEGALP